MRRSKTIDVRTMLETHWPFARVWAQVCVGEISAAIVTRLGGAMSDIPINREFWDRLVREVRSRARG
ncbi:MAG: hypothetical protein ABI608_03065, partial [Rhizomicrobium sp.]